MNKNLLNGNLSVDVTNEEWYKNADAVFNAHMADYYAPGQPGSYSQYFIESRKNMSNLDPLQTMGYLHSQQAIDSNWEYAQNLGKSLYNGGIGVVRDTLNGIRAARDYNIALLNEQAKAQGFERNPDPDFINALDNAAKADALQPYEVKQSASRLGQFGLDLAEGAGQLVGQMAGSAALNAVLPGVGGMALMVGQITGGQYEQLKEKGVDTKRAATAAFYNAIAQAPFEYMSLTRLMRKVPAGSVLKKKLKMVLEDMFTEGITEAIQQFPEEWAELWALNPDKSWKELQTMAAKKFPDTLQNALYAGLIGGVLGAGSRGIHIALDRNIDLALRKELHDERQATVESRINHIKQSGISPDYAGETVNANLNNATVLIDGDTLNTYAQRVGEEKAAEKLGVTVDTIREAAKKGDTVEVKQGNFEALSASDPSFYQEVRDALSFDVNDISNQKYNQIQVNIENYSKLNEQKRTELKTEVDKIAATLEEAGANKSVVAGWKAFYTAAAVAARPDNPAQWVRDNPLRFERGVTRMTQPSLNISSKEDDLNLVKDILTANYENPREEVESRIKEVYKEINEIIKPVYDELDKHYEANDEWYQKHIGLNNPDLTRVASEIVSGERNVPGFETTEEQKRKLIELYKRRNTLGSLLGNGVNHIAGINDYKKIYDREGGTFNFPKPQQTDKYFQVSAEEFERQKSEVRKQYKGTDQWMKAPNGKPTNLNEDQWVTVRTAAFKNWFGDWENDPANASKVVDANGEPLVVYHGTPYGGFEEFRKDRQAYFTPHAWYADKYHTPNASAIRDRYDAATQPQTYPVFLNIRKPFDTRNAAERKIWDEEYYRQWGTGAPLTDKGLPDWTDGLDLQEFFEENEYDYDGLILDEGGFPDGEGGVVSRGVSYVTFKPNQIKDATGRNVGFDPESGNIFLQTANNKLLTGNQEIDIKNLNTKNFHLNKRNRHNKHGKIYLDENERKAAITELVITAWYHDSYQDEVNFPPSEKLKNLIKTILGNEIDSVYITADDVQHIRNRHSKNQEKQGQVNVTPNHLFEIHDIVNNFNSGEEGKIIEGNKTIKLYHNGVNVSIAILHKSGSTRARIKTFLIKKIKSTQVTDGTESPSRNVQNGPAPTLSSNIIAQENNNSNTNPQNYNFDALYQKQNDKSEIKGSFDPFTEGEAVIKLFEGADASTVIHETGHYYIESMWREIAAGMATEQQKADFEKLMKYCGITTAQWAKMGTEGRRAAHERLAEAIETYVMEDKAPTRELRPVFKRFAKWLKAVYAAVSRTRNAVPLTDEVREVFDRMLASEEDVEQMRRVEGYFEKLPSVITDNLSDATKKRIEDYILKAQDKAVEILTKERLANFSEDRKREIENFRNMISDEVRQEVANRPLYVAARQAQELLGGEKPASAKQYANLYLEEKMSDENEVKWEIVAEQNNMSPSELAQKLLEEPSENEAYEAAMKEAVQKEFPDYYTEREQAEEATRQAMYNDESGILLGVEQTLIEDFATRAAAQQRSAETARKLAMAKRQQAKVAAQKELANMKLKDAIRVDRFIAAERRCAVKSAEAMAKKDYETAKQYKDMQAFNHACVIESANLRKRKQQYDKMLRRLFRAKRETWTSEQHFNQAMQLFARMGLMNPAYDPTTRTQSLVEYVNEMSEVFYPFNEIPEWLADDTWPIADPKNMRFEEYEKVIDLMRYIKAMAKVEKAANFFDSNSTYQEWRDQAIDNLNKLATKFAPVLGEKQVATWMQRFKAGYQTLDNFLERMDGWHFGFFSRSFGDAIKHANDNEFIHIEAYQKRKAEIEQAWCPDDKTLAEKTQDVYYEELGTSASKFVLTKMLMNLGNEGNARKLCSSYPSEALRNSSLWVFENGMLTRDEAIAQTKENLLEFLGRVLTKEDIAYAQAKIDLAGMYWGEMADLDRRTKGFTPKKVEAYPVTLTMANGEQIVFRGGYFPLIRNGEMGSHPVGVMPVSDTDPNQGKNIRTMHTDTGHTKARVDAQYPVDLSEGSEDRAMRAAIHDLCWRETMTDFRRILNDQFMFGLMKSKLGIAQMSALREMLEQAAQPNGGQSMAMAEGLLATTAGWLRRKTVNSIVMLNLRINLQNFGNFFLYGNTVEGFGYSDVLGAMGNAMSKGFEGKSFSEMWDFVDQKSAYMRERSTTPDITLAQLREEGKLNKLERSAMEWGAKAMMYTDGLTARPVWMQAYTKKINAGATEQEAIDFADTVIRRTLGSGRVTDVASLQRGEPIYRLFTAFQGFFNTQFNQWVREYNVDMRLLSEGNTAEAVQRITAFVASKYLAACMFNLLLSLENPFADDDDDEYKNYTTELIHYPMSLIGIYGAVTNEIIDSTLGMKSYGYRMSIIQSSVEKMFRTSGKIRKMVEGNFEEGLEGISDLAGMYYGVPAQMNRLFWNAYDIFVNGMDPRLEDLATRRPKRERK